MSYSEAVKTMAGEDKARFDPTLLKQFLEISEKAYRGIVAQDIHELEETVLSIINRYFRFSPTIEDLRVAFGSIARREHSPDPSQDRS